MVQPTSKEYGGFMNNRLPARPNLEHLRTQAKALLTKLRQGDSKAARTFIEHLPEAAGLSPKQVRERGFRLADASSNCAEKRIRGMARFGPPRRPSSKCGGNVGVPLAQDGWAGGPRRHAAELAPVDRLRPVPMESPGTTYEGIFTIDVEQSPHQIDIDFIEGPEAGNRCEGIFELEGDHFRICLGLVGSARPAGFATAPGTGHALEELVRAERARPARVAGGTPPASTPEPAPVISAGDFDATLSSVTQMLQGEWLPLELIPSGAPVQASHLPFGSRIHSGVETKVVSGGQTMVHAKIRFNEAAAPIEVDYLNLTGTDKGTISLGLFR
jgi:hypothetical protein